MFPNNYSYNPGMVLDPNTMTPMISATSFTVNPFGVPMKPEQKVWQKMFLKNIPTECTNQNLLKFLREFGQVKNFKRMNDSRGNLLQFCHFDLETGEEILRIKRLFSRNGDKYKILDKLLEIKISADTEKFLKEWMDIQKDQWRKKLKAPGMNEAKQYNTIEDYHEREDPSYKQRIEDKLKEINVDVKRAYIEKLREQQKREHPKEKEREKKKKKQEDEMMRSFRQQEEYLLRRERNKEKQYRRQREREREKQRAKFKRLEKELEITQEEQERRIRKYLAPERMKQVEKQQLEDLLAIQEEHPPEPEEEEPIEAKKKSKFYLGQKIEVGRGEKNGEHFQVQIQGREMQIQNEGGVKPDSAFQESSSQSNSDDSEDKKQIALKLPQMQNPENHRKQDELPAQLLSQIPQNKIELYDYQINWQKLSQSVSLQRNIRPFLEECSYEYMGSVEEKFIALVEKKLFSCSHPDKIIKIMRQLIDEDAEEFVFRLWRKLVEEDLKVKHGLL